jgi:hypothetical protein
VADAARTTERASLPPSPASAPGAGGRRVPSWWLSAVAGVLIVGQLVVRAWTAAGGSFYQDDLRLIGRAATFPLFSTDLLLHPHDGHFMPAGFFLAGLVTQWFPLQWWACVASVVLLQALASLAVLRLLRVLLGSRPVILLPLILYLFSPLTLPSFVWWANALNAVPLQAGLAWVTAEAVLLVRTGRLRYAASGSAGFVLALLFFEKSLVIPWFALAVAWLVGWVDGESAALRTALRRGRPLWWSAVVVSAVWAWAYLALSTPPATPVGRTAATAAEIMARGLTHAALPTLLGGPWSWGRVIPGMPWTDPPAGLVVGGVGLLLFAFGWSLRNRRRTGLVWLLVVGYLATCLVAMVVGRVGADTPLVLPQTLRYIADTSVAVVVGIALVVRAQPRDRRPPALLTPPGRRVAVAGAVALFLIGSAYSTVAFARLWAGYPTAGYLATVRSSLANAGPAPLFDQPAPELVIGRLAHPENLASHVLAALPDRPPFGTWTPDLRMIDESGRLVPARVSLIQTLRPGPGGTCGYHVTTGDVLQAPFEAGLLDYEWTMQLDLYANRDGTLQVSLSTGRAVIIPVHRGLDRVYLRLIGGGADLRLSTTTTDISVCVTGAIAGQVEPLPAG